VQFWTKFGKAHFYYDYVTILVNNQPLLIEKYYPQGLFESSAGSAEGQIDLPPGLYFWQATFENYSVSDTITINRGTCVLREIKF